jgi:hypothetical protein
MSPKKIQKFKLTSVTLIATCTVAELVVDASRASLRNELEHAVLLKGDLELL